MPTLGSFIRRRRQELDLTQEELANLVGDNTRQADISRLENDRVSLPRRARLEALAKALQVSPGLLLAKSGWEGGEEIDSQSGADLATQVEGLRSSLPDEGEPFEEHHQVIADALPAISETVTQMHELVHQAETIIDETRTQVESTKSHVKE